MSINKGEATDLREALIEQREQLDREIARLDSYLQGDGGEPFEPIDPVKAAVVNPQHV